MKNLYKILAIMAILIGVSCDDFLERDPLDVRVEDNFYQTQEDARESLVAAYDILQWNTVIGFHQFEMFSDILSDDSYAGGASSTDAPNIVELDKFRVRTNNGEVYGLWQKYYKGIFRANKFMEEVVDIPFEDENEKSLLIAEAKFLRAYFYFDLIRLFENVPLIMETFKDTDYSAEQVAPKIVYDQIAKDLTEAIVDLPEVLIRDNNGRITKWAAQAELVKVFLFYNGVYGADLDAGTEIIDASRALQLAEEIISSSGHDLMPDFGDIFSSAHEFNIESIFEIPYNDTRNWFDWGFIQGGQGSIAVQMQGIRGYTGPEYTAGWSFSTVTHDLENAFEAGDSRMAATMITVEELTGEFTPGYQHTGRYNKKYTTSKDYQGDGQTELNWGNNYRVIRLADVLLMASELNLMAGSQGNADLHLNRVRQRAGLADKSNVTLDDVYQERRVELGMEGHRYWDLLRRGLNVAEAEITVTDYVKEGTDEGDPQDFEIQFNAATKGFMPIPQSEIDLSGLTQNAGY